MIEWIRRPSREHLMLKINEVKDMTYEEYTEKFNQLVDAYEKIDDGFIKSDIKNEIISLQKSYNKEVKS